VEAGRAGPESSAGLGCAAGGKRTRGKKLRGSRRTSQRWAAAKTGLASWFSSLLFPISNSIKTSKQLLNSNQDLNPNTQKQCTSMNATVNSYISLI
jgi:hypothetical protein